METAPRSILVIRRNRLGDMICTLPLIHALKKRYPSAMLQVLTESAGAIVAQVCPSVDRVHRFRSWVPRWAWSWGHRDFLKGHDLLVVAKGGEDRALGRMARASGAPVRLGFGPEYTVEIPLPPYEHQLETLARLVKPLGIESVPDDFTVILPPEALRRVESIADPLSLPHFSRVLLFNLTCNRGQYWPQERYVDLVKSLVADASTAVMVLKSLEDDQASRLVESVNHSGCRLVEFADILELGAFLKKCRGLVTPEGGLAHWAAAMGTPAVVLWKPGGVIQKWRSRGQGHFDFQPPAGLDAVSVTEMRELLNEKLP